MAVSETLGLEVVITGASKVISELGKVDSAAGALALGLKGVGRIGSAALNLLTTPLRAIGKVAGLAWSGLKAVARSILRIGEYVIGNLIARAITAIGSAIWNMAKASVQAAADMQLMQVMIEGLLARELMYGTAIEGIRVQIRSRAEAEALLAAETENRAEAMTKELMMMALISPFQIAQTNETFRLAMAYGMGSEQAMEFTQAALDTAAGLGMSNVAMQRFVYNLAQAVVGGDLTGINLRQLSLTSFNLAQVLRDELGMSIEEVREALKSGQLTLEEVSDAFVHHAEVVWAGAAERARNTWTGFKNSLEDLNNVMGALIIEPSLEAISMAAVPLFDAFTEVVGAGTFEIMGQQLGEMAERGLELLPVDNIVKAMPAAFEAIVRLLEGDWKMAWWNALTAVQLIFGDEAKEKMKEYEQVYYDAIDGIKALLEGDFKKAWEKTKEVIIGVFGEDTREPLETFETVVLAIGTAIETVKGVLAGDIGLDELVTPQMAKVIEAFQNVLRQIGVWFEEYGPDIKKAADEMLEKMGVNSKDLADQVLPWLVEQLDKFSIWFRNNGPLIERVVLKIMEAFTKMSGNITEWWEVIAPKLDNFITNMLGILTFLMTVFVYGWDVAWLYLLTVINNAWNDIQTAIDTKIVEIFSAIASWLEEVQVAWNENWENMKEELTRIWEAILDAAPGWLADLYDIIDNAILDQVQAIIDYKDEFIAGGAALISGLIEGIKSKALAAINAVLSVLRGAWAAAQTYIRGRSPSQLYAEMGVSIVEGLIQGVESKAEDFAEVMEGLFDVAGTISGIGGFFAKLYETQTLKPLRDELETIEDQLSEGARNRRTLEELITAERTQQIKDAYDAELDGIKERQQAEEEEIGSIREVRGGALSDEHDLALQRIAEEFDIREDEIRAIIRVQEDERKTFYDDEKDGIQQRYDDEEVLIKNRYDEDAALFNDQIDAEKRAIRDRNDIEEEEMYVLLDAVDARKRQGRRDLAALERGEITALGVSEQAERDAITTNRRAALDALQQEEEARIRVLGVQEQAAIDDVITRYEAQLAGADLLERAALERLIAASEEESRLAEQRMEDEITALDIRIEKGWQAIMGEERRLALLQEIADEEARILELKEKQEQLKLLEQQMKLLELIDEYELDAASILEGLTLGLDADAGGVLDAMTVAMDQIIAAIEERLEIASPSGVFADIGHEMMGGLAVGIADLTPAVVAQINAAVSPTMGGGGGGNTYNYYDQSSMQHNLTTQSVTQPGALALEFDAMEMASR